MSNLRMLSILRKILINNNAWFLFLLIIYELYISRYDIWLGRVNTCAIVMRIIFSTKLGQFQVNKLTSLRYKNTSAHFKCKVVEPADSTSFCRYFFFFLIQITNSETISIDDDFDLQKAVFFLYKHICWPL